MRGGTAEELLLVRPVEVDVAGVAVHGPALVAAGFAPVAGQSLQNAFNGTTEASFTFTDAAHTFFRAVIQK